MATESAETPKSPQLRRVRRVVLWIFGGLVLIALVVYFANPGPPRFGETLDVDINSGHVRHKMYFLGMTPVDRVESTWVSDAMSRSGVKDKNPDWHQVLTLELRKEGAAQPPYHGAAAQIRTLAVAKELDVWTPDAELAVAQGLMDRWQHGGSDSAARRFVDVVQQTSLDAAHSKTKLTADNIRSLKIDDRK